jgi:DNA-binding CsgD family transcriptional regulator
VRVRVEQRPGEAEESRAGSHGEARGAFVPLEVQIDGRVYRLVEEKSEPARPAPRTQASVAEPSAARAPLAACLLTARELEVATLVASGRPNKQIASALGISEWTVSTHLRRIFAKLGVDSRAAMVARCFGASAGARPR